MKYQNPKSQDFGFFIAQYFKLKKVSPEISFIKIPELSE